jgi:6-phosphogluconolactonase
MGEVNATGGVGKGRARLVRLPEAAAVAQAAAEEVTRRAEAAVAARGRFNISLSGGSTPRALYALLADPAAPWRGRVPWAQVHVFFGDERSVPPDHPDSNFRMAQETLLRHVPVAGVHRMEGERPAAEAAERYEATLRRELGVEVPAFDVALMGLGVDGHTASLFAGSPALDERARWVVAPFVPHLGARRITLTVPVFERARALIFLVAGAEKARALARLLDTPPGEDPIPAARIRPAHEQLVLADAAAAAAVLSADPPRVNPRE